VTWPSWTRNNKKSLARYANMKLAEDAVPAGFFQLESGNGAQSFNQLRQQKKFQEVAKCLYEKLLTLCITYDLEPLRLEDPNNTKQDIRTPAEVLKRGGTCLDLALLFAALCLDVRLLPMVVLLGGADSDHALVVLDLNYDASQWQQPRGLRDIYRKEGLLADKQAKDYILERINDNRWLAVETTGFAEIPRLSFNEACKKGEEQITNRTHVATIDIASLQGQGETPHDLLDPKLGELIDQLVRNKGVPAAPLREVLSKLGEAGIPDGEIPARLNAAADEVIELRAQLTRLRNERPDLAAVRERTLTLIDRGELDQASSVLSGGRAAARALREEASRSEAELLADEARINHLQLAYRAAAANYAEAAALVARFDPEGEGRFLNGEAGEFYGQGDEFGDNGALAEAIAIYQRLLTLRPRSKSPLDWAETQNNLGNALQTLGKRESGTARLEEAVTAYREALKERTRERVPLDWAATQNNLGIALRALGERESGTERFEEAVTAYREALKEYKRERVPLDWATTQTNLGNALLALGERDSGTDRLEEAVTAFREALKERTRERVPLDWAATQTNLGTALGSLGERESGTERLEEAVTAFREALKEYRRERVPLDWATTQNNLGNALQTLGDRESSTARLKEAVTACREALKERTRERVPLDWAATQTNRGNTLSVLGEREGATERLEEAIAAYREALKEYTRDRVPLDWAMTQNNLGVALWTLGERESGTERIEEAVTAYREALKERTRARVPLKWAGTQNNLGNALWALGQRERGTERLEEAIVAYQHALEVYEGTGASYYFDLVRGNLARAEQLLAKRRG
jgi:tetratricopeptide (TPR) repeat protein